MYINKEGKVSFSLVETNGLITGEIQFPDSIRLFEDEYCHDENSDTLNQVSLNQIYF